jgi:hypothetical protein
MTFTEYNNQVEAQRLPTGSVILEKGEYQVIPMGHYNLFILWVAGRYFTYTTNPPSYVREDKLTLWGTDGDGNPKTPSCFAVKTKDLE